MKLRPTGCDQQGRYPTRTTGDDMTAPRIPRIWGRQQAPEMIDLEQRQAGLRDDDTIPEPTATHLAEWVILGLAVLFVAGAALDRYVPAWSLWLLAVLGVA